MTASVLSVQGLKKVFAGDRPGVPSRVVFADVTFDVAAKEACVIVGPSGAGKSTLLRCLNGLETADEGAVVVGSQSLDRRATELDRAQTRRLVGMVFQQFHLFAHMTVVENVAEGPRAVMRLPRAMAFDRAEHLLHRVGLEHRRHAYPRELSGGEQQRTAIARALAMQPLALLMDEPTSALDDDRVSGLLDLVHSLMADGLAVVCATHDRRWAAGLAGSAGSSGRVGRLSDGRLAF